MVDGVLSMFGYLILQSNPQVYLKDQFEDETVMLVTYFGCWCPTFMLGHRWCQNRHQHFKNVINTFHLQHPLLTSI